MASREPTIVVMGGGWVGIDRAQRGLGDYLLDLAGTERPKICYLPTAGGDARLAILEFLERFPYEDCRPTHLSLFRRSIEDLRGFLLDQDIIYVGGGNTANLLAVWRVHGLDTILKEAWEQGVVLAGGSAGSLCWYECGVTDSFGQDLSALDDGFGFLAGSHCPHYAHEGQQRRAKYHGFLLDERLPAGTALQDDFALRYAGVEIAEAVSQRDDARGFHVRVEGGVVIEDEIIARRL